MWQGRSYRLIFPYVTLTFVENSKCRGCRCRGDEMSQGMSSNGIGLYFVEYTFGIKCVLYAQLRFCVQVAMPLFCTNNEFTKFLKRGVSRDCVKSRRPFVGVNGLNNMKLLSEKNTRKHVVWHTSHHCAAAHKMRGRHFVLRRMHDEGAEY